MTQLLFRVNVFYKKLKNLPNTEFMDPPSCIFGIRGYVWDFPLKIFDTKISFNSTSGECIIYRFY